MTTFVTGFFNLPKLEKNVKRRSLDIYLKYSDVLLQKHINLIFFGDEEVALYVFKKRKEYGLLEKTFLYPMSFNELPSTTKLPEINTIYEEKGIFETKESFHYTPHYLACIWAKPFLLQKAAILNVFDTSYFYWIDFGYFKLEKEFPDSFKTISIQNFKIIEDLHPMNDCLKLTVLGKPNFSFFKNRSDFYKADRYYVAGGLFGGSQPAIHKLNELFNKELDTTLSLKILTNEENLFAMIAYNNPKHFDITVGFYTTLLQNFCYISAAIDKAYDYVNLFRLNENHYFETQLCEKLLLGYKLKKINFTNDQLINIYSSVLISSYYVDYSLYKKYVDEILIFFHTQKINLTDLMQKNLKF